MTDILCRWLNDELNLSQKVDQLTFARDFSSGFLIGEVLYKYQLQDDFDHFSHSRTADSKLNNFTRLEPVLHLLAVPFDTNVARDIMMEQHGTATRLLYQMYIALNNKKKANMTAIAMQTQRPAAPAKLNNIESSIYKERLKQLLPRQTDLNLKEVSSKFLEQQSKMEQRAFRNRFLETEARIQQHQMQRQLLLQRQRLIHAKRCEMVAKIQAATVHIPKPPPKLIQSIEERKALHRKREAEETIDAISKFEERLKLMQVPSEDSDEIDVAYIVKRDEEGGGDKLHYLRLTSNDEYIGKIRKRLHEDASAREEREKRRRKVLSEQMSAHEAQEEARREEMMVNRLMRQSQQERRIAVQLLQARHEKEVIRQNRQLRETQYQERRQRDFEDAMNREAEMAQLYKEEYREQLQWEQERHDALAAQRLKDRYARHYDMCSEIANQIIDFACKVGEYRELTERLLPPKLMREWTELFINGCPLYDPALTESGELSAEQILEEERVTLLDEEDFNEYKTMTGEWQPPEGSEVTGPPRENPVLGHIIHRLLKIVHPPIPPTPPPEFPPFPIRACVLGKAFSGKSTVLQKLAQEHRLVILEVEKLVKEAIEAHQNNEIVQVVPEHKESDGDLPEKLSGVPVAATPSRLPVAEGGDTATDIAAQVEPIDLPGVTAVPEAPEVVEKVVSIEKSVSQAAMERSEAKSESQEQQAEESKPSERNILGGRALKFLKRGKAVDDQTIVDILAQAIRSIPEDTGWVADGYPQTYAQAKLFERALSGFKTGSKESLVSTRSKRSSIAVDPRPLPPPPEHRSGIDLVILLDIDDQLCLKRATGRTEMIQAQEKFHEEFKPPPEGSATGVLKQEKVEPVTDPSYDQQQIQHRLTAFHESWPKLEKWFTRFGSLQKVNANDPHASVYMEVEKALEELMKKSQGSEVLTSDLSEEKEESPKEEEPASEMAPGGPPEPEAEPAKEEVAPGGPDQQPRRMSRPSSRRLSRGGSGAKRSASSTSPLASPSKTDKLGSPKPSEAVINKKASAATHKEKKRKGSPKGKRHSPGKKGKTPEPEPEPQPEEPPGPPPPQPGDDDWQFVDLDLEHTLAEILCTQWEGTEKNYVSNLKHVFRHVRQERECIYRYFYQIKKDYLAYLQRPDHKQEFVTQWQNDFNQVHPDLRPDEETKAELHQRVDDLRERLWNICDERKEQAERERGAMLSDGWLDDRLGVLINHYTTQMQAELDLYQDSMRLLKDYYKGLDGQIPDELNINYDRLPLVDMPMERPDSPPPEKSESEVSATTVQSEENHVAHSGGHRTGRSLTPKSPKGVLKERSKSPKEKEGSKSPKVKDKDLAGRKSMMNSGKKASRGNKEKEQFIEPPSPVDGAGLRIEIPLINRRTVSPDAEGRSGTGAGKKEKKAAKKAGEEVTGTDSPLPPSDPDEKLLFEAHAFACNAINGIMAVEDAAREAEEAAAKALELEKEKKTRGKGKKAKSRSPSPKKGKKGHDRASISPHIGEEMTEEEKQQRATREKMRQEYYFAIKEEEAATKARLELIRLVASAVVMDLKHKADSSFRELNDWLGARFLKEMEAIDAMTEVLRHTIEEGRQLKEQVVLQQEDFLVNEDVQTLKDPTPPPTPPPVEQIMPDQFTVNQLFNLFKQFSTIAPMGIISCKSFMDIVNKTVSVSLGTEQVPESWMKLSSSQVLDMCNFLATETDYVDWRRLLVPLTWPIPTPTQAQLLDTLQHCKDMDQKAIGFITRQQFDRMDLWFDLTPVEAGEYDRLTNLKKILFDIFANDRYVLDYVSMLLYYSAMPNSHEGFLRALSVASGCHMPRIQKPPSPTQTIEAAASAAESSNPVQAEEEKELGAEEKAPASVPSAPPAPVEPPMSGEEIPEEANDALVPLCALFRVLNHSDVSSGDSHRFSTTADGEDLTSLEKLTAMYEELGGSVTTPLMYRILIEHPLIQDLIVSCKTYKLLDMKAILSTGENNTELLTNKTVSSD